MRRAYDAIVCGGSFGGLAAAQQMGGRVLVLDRLDIGEGETSASAIPLACLENMGMAHVIGLGSTCAIHILERSGR